MQDLFRKRRSIRKYSQKNISDKKIKSILNAAIWAPSAHNAQPWRFIVISKSDLKLKLAKAMAEKWKNDLRLDRVNEKIRKGLISQSIRKFTEPPVMILVCLTMKDMQNYGNKRNEAEYTMAIQSVAVACENILLAAKIEGLGSCWYCAPLFCKDLIREILKIPSDVEPQALIAIGYSEGKPLQTSRKDLEEISYMNYWGNKL
jgi:coenzyme F420-0:L-glutamate ligase/coenzyme F420-1:gamma-L-glutamate ligase